MKKLVEELIDRYISCAASMCDIFKNSFVLEESILRSRRIGIIPPKGKIGDVRYSFHGVGCYFKFKGGEIDVDFGPENRCDGFDAHRLYDFFDAMLLSKKKAFDEIESPDQIQNQLQILLMDGVIIRPNLGPSPHLYYLKSRW